MSDEYYFSFHSYHSQIGKNLIINLFSLSEDIENSSNEKTPKLTDVILPWINYDTFSLIKIKSRFASGTGTNACYVEKTSNVECAIPGNFSEEKPYMLINIEWGAFGEGGVLDFILTEFDRAIDENSINPSKQLFEKMISGMYMGELTRLVLEKVVNAGLLFGGKCPSDLKKRGKFFTKYVSEIEK